MSFWDIFKKKDENKTEQIMEERQDLKEQLANKLKNQFRFSSIEVREVMLIISDAENEIQQIKDSLIGTNINTDPNEQVRKLENAKAQIRQIRDNMKVKIAEKVRQIKERKQQLKQK